MLQLYDKNKKKIAALTEYENLCIESILESGDKTLSFYYSLFYKFYDEIEEETYIRTKTDEYVVKAKGGDSNDNKTLFTCKLNVEELEGTIFDRFESVEQNLVDALNLAIVGTGWRLNSDNCNNRKKRTIRMTNCSSWTIIQKAKKLYDIEFKFDTLNKIIMLFDKIGDDRGIYFIDSLNLRALQVQGNSYGFYTRIIPTGKDGLTIASVNGGKTYLENKQYSNKTLTYYWKDERYTKPESLKEDALEKLNIMSKPFKSYIASTINLAKMNGKYKDILDYNLGDYIYLISKKNKVKDKHRIVKTKEYPQDHSKDTVELANKALDLSEEKLLVDEMSNTLENITTDNGTVDGSTIDSITTKQIEDFEANVIKVAKLKAILAEIENLHVNKADIQNLNAVIARIGTLEATKASITELNAIHAIIQQIKAGKADITDLNAAVAKVGILENKTAVLENALAGNLTADNFKTNAITAGSAVIAEGAIGSSQISSLSVNKLEAGDITTSKHRIVSADGTIEIVGNQILINRNNVNRVVLGEYRKKDGTTEYGLLVRAKDGQTVMLDGNGVHNAGITDGAIDNNKVADNANISGNKLDINSVIREVNTHGTETIKGTKVQIGDRTLDVELSTQKNAITEHSKELSSQKASLTALDNALKFKVDSQTFTQSTETINSNINIAKEEAIKAAESLALEKSNLAKKYADEVATAKANLAKTEAIANADGKISAEEKKRIQQAQENLNTAISKADKAKQDAILEANRVAELKKQEAISSANSHADSKANEALNNAKAFVNAEITTVNSHLNKATSEINVLKEKIESKVSQSDIDKSIANIKLGERNLLRNTGLCYDAKNWYFDHPGIGRSENVDPNLALNNHSIYFNVNGIKNDSWRACNPDKVSCIGGEVFSASVMLMIPSIDNRLDDGDNIGALEIQFWDSYGTRIKIETTSFRKGTITTDKWYKVVCENRVAPPNAVKVNARVWVRRNGRFWVGNLKLVKGRTIGDWSPAPEDSDTFVIDNIKTVTDKISTVESKFTQENNSIKASVQDLNSTTQSITTNVSNINRDLTSKINSNLDAAKSFATDIATNKANEALNNAKAYTNAEITTINSKVHNVESNLNILSDRINTKVSQSDIDKAVTTIRTERIIYARGTGNDYPANSIVKVNGKTITDGQGRGLRINALNKATLERIFLQDYDTFGSEDAKVSFVNKINELNNGDFIIIITSQDASYPLHQPIKEALEKIGATLFDNRQGTYREAYALIGKSKLGRGNGVEMFIPRTANDKRFAEVSVKVGEDGTFIGVNPNNMGLEATLIKSNISDVSSSVTQLRDSVTTDIRAINSKTQSIETTLNGKASKQEVTAVDSKITTIKADLSSITQRVSSAEVKTNKLNDNIQSLSSRMASAEQKITPTAIINTVSSTIDTRINNIEIGGRNYILNSNFINLTPGTSKIDKWKVWGDISVFGRQGQENYNENGVVYLGALKGGGIWQELSSKLIKKDTEYTLSLLVGQEGNVKKSDCYIEYWNGNSKIKTVQIFTFSGGLSLERRSFKFRTITNNFTEIRLVLNHEGASTTSAYLLQVGLIKLEEGKFNTAWTPAPEDVTQEFSEMKANFSVTINGINSEVSKKVNFNEIISRINQSAEAVKIDANKINLQGYVTMSNLGTPGQTVIDGRNIKTGFIEAIQLIAPHITGKVRAYFEAGSVLSSDGEANFKRFYGMPGGTFNVESEATFGSIVNAARFRCNGNYVPFSRSGYKWVVESLQGIDTPNGDAIEFQMVGGTKFGVNIWYSDARLKTDIEAINPLRNISTSTNKTGLELIKAINHYKFRYKSNPTNKIECGYVAQDLQRHNKQIVNSIKQSDGTEILQVDERTIIPNLSLAIQEQQKIIEKLERRIEELERIAI